MKIVAREACALSDLLVGKSNVSRTRVRKWLKHGMINVDGRVVTRPEAPVLPGQAVEISRSAPSAPFPILYEDSNLMATEKPPGVLSIGTERERSNTFYRRVNEYLRIRSRGKERIFIVHRLDREVSGIMLFAKSKAIQDALQRNWDRTEKLYSALVEGHPPEKNGSIRSWLTENRAHKVYSCPEGPAAMYAVTHYRVLKRYPRHTLLEIRLETGRKNQIRAHLSELGCPIAGDRKYGASEKSTRRLALHAYALSFTHPVTGERITLRSPVPEIFHSPATIT